MREAPVIWFVDVAKVREEGKKREWKMSLGYCTAGKGVAFVTSSNPLYILVVNSVTFHEIGGVEHCGDEKWCLNLKCPFNRVDLERLKKKGVETREDLEKIHNLFEQLTSDLKELYGEEILEAEKAEIVYFKHPPVFEILIRRKPQNS